MSGIKFSPGSIEWFIFFFHFQRMRSGWNSLSYHEHPEDNVLCLRHISIPMCMAVPGIHTFPSSTISAAHHPTITTLPAFLSLLKISKERRHTVCHRIEWNGSQESNWQLKTTYRVEVVKRKEMSPKRGNRKVPLTTPLPPPQFSFIFTTQIYVTGVLTVYFTRFPKDANCAFTVASNTELLRPGLCRQGSPLAKNWQWGLLLLPTREGECKWVHRSLYVKWKMSNSFVPVGPRKTCITDPSRINFSW